MVLNMGEKPPGPVLCKLHYPAISWRKLRLTRRIQVGTSPEAEGSMSAQEIRLGFT